MDNSLALCIGIGKRDADAEGMVVTGKDAGYVASALKVYCKIPANNILTISDEAAVKSNIETQLAELARKTQTNKADLVVIYFSGHGAKFPDDYYLLANDTDNEDIEGTGISGKIFSGLLTDIQADKMLIFLDCCHAGGIAKTDVPFVKNVVLENKNRLLLTACHESQISYLSWPASIFTYALVEGMAGISLKTGDRSVTIFELAMYVRERVAVLSARILGNVEFQQPQLNVLENSLTVNFTIADYPNGRAKPLIFDDGFQLYNSQEQSKSIDLSAGIYRDEAYRAKFEWIQNENNIVSVGNSGYILQGLTGNKIEIKSGITAEELIVIINQTQEPYKQLTKLIEQLLSDKTKTSDQLLNTIEKSTEVMNNTTGNYASTILIIERCIYDPNDENLGKAIWELQRVAKESIHALEVFAITLQADFKRYKDYQLTGFNVEERFLRILIRLKSVYEEFKKLTMQ